MKLAEALLERADLNTRIESMRGRLANNARYLAKRVSVLKEFYRNVSSVVTRLTHTEVKILPAYDINKLQRDIDACSKELREVDTLLQESNWTAELIESK